MVRKPVTKDEVSRRELALIERYGGVEELAAKRREWQAKSRKNYKGTGGFAANPKLAKRMSKKALEARWNNHESSD